LKVYSGESLGRKKNAMGYQKEYLWDAAMKNKYDEAQYKSLFHVL